MTSASVLVVDDQPEVREVLRRILERSGRYAIAEASGALEAVSLLQEHPPDAVILDISMPQVSGLSVISEIHTHAPDAKIIVLSGHFGMKQEILSMGAHAFLDKTASPKKVLATLADVLKQ